MLDLRDRIAGKLRDLVAVPVVRGFRQATIVAIASSKGGVGKTTTAVNLAVAMAQTGLKVLLIDLDPQAHVMTSLGAKPPARIGYLSDVLLGTLREVCEIAFAAPGSKNLDLAGSDKQLAETEMILSAKIGKELILAGALDATATHYDIILLDCPPNVGTLALNALCAAHYLLIPTDMSVLALEGVSDIITAVETVRSRLGRKLKIGGILATRYDRRATRTNDTVLASLADLHGDKLLKSRIPQSSALNKAHMACKSVFDYAPRSPGAVAYRALAEELTERLGLERQTVAATAARAVATG